MASRLPRNLPLLQLTIPAGPTREEHTMKLADIKPGVVYLVNRSNKWREYQRAYQSNVVFNEVSPDWILTGPSWRKTATEVAKGAGKLLKGRVIISDEQKEAGVQERDVYVPPAHVRATLEDGLAEIAEFDRQRDEENNNRRRRAEAADQRVAELKERLTAAGIPIGYGDDGVYVRRNSPHSGVGVSMSGELLAQILDRISS